MKRVCPGMEHHHRPPMPLLSSRKHSKIQSSSSPSLLPSLRRSDVPTEVSRASSSAPTPHFSRGSLAAEWLSVVYKLMFNSAAESRSVNLGRPQTPSTVCIFIRLCNDQSLVSTSLITPLFYLTLLSYFMKYTVRKKSTILYPCRWGCTLKGLQVNVAFKLQKCTMRNIFYQDQCFLYFGYVHKNIFLYLKLD